jgi:hypothetical protein
MVSLMTNRQVRMMKGARGKALDASGRARQMGARQSVRAREAAAQMAPLARNAQLTAKQRVYGARVWAAPRLERMGQTLQDDVAPRMSAVLSATARKVQPTSPPRRRWPVLAAGMLMIAGGCAAAAVALSRRNPGSVTVFGQPGESARSAADPHDMAAAEPASADVNGHGHTS